MDDEELKRIIRERGHALWEADGRPEGRERDYWIKVEEKLMSQSAAGEEDPMEALDHEAPEVPKKGEAS